MESQNRPKSIEARLNSVKEQAGDIRNQIQAIVEQVNLQREVRCLEEAGKDQQPTDLAKKPTIDWSHYNNLGAQHEEMFSGSVK